MSLTYNLLITAADQKSCAFQLQASDGVQTKSLNGRALFAQPISDITQAADALNAVIASPQIEGGVAPLDEYKNLLASQFAGG